MEGKSVRLTGTSYAVLALLAHLGEATPYDLRVAIEQSIENFWPVPHTTSYAEPARLAAAGLLSEEQEPGGRRRKVYRLTAAGREALEAWADDTALSPPQLRDESILKIFAGADPAPLLAARRAWCEAKLAELEGYLARDPWGMDDRTPVERTLMAGIAYHRLTIELIDGLAAALAPEGPDGGAAARER